MSLTLKWQRDGRTLRKFWYGEYRDANGRRKVMNCGKWHGIPPSSGSWRDQGDKDFEVSRQNAKEALEEQAEEERRKGRADHLTERLIESKTGKAVQYVRIDELSERWRNLLREDDVTKTHLMNCDAHFRRFNDFMRENRSKAVYLYQVTPEDAAAFISAFRATFAPATVRYGRSLISKAFSRFLPVGAANPFAGFVGRRKHGPSGVIHRKPFTPDELTALLEAARGDDFMFPLVVTAMCTGMRRGDICRLKWSDVDCAKGMIRVKTSKTGGNAEIPIFAPLRAVLEPGMHNAKGYVFPQAAAMYRSSPARLSRNFKLLVVRALDKDPPKALPEPAPATAVEAEAIAAILQHVRKGPRQDRMLDTLKRYCSGQSIRAISKETGRPKGTLSYDLNLVQDWAGKRFLRSAQAPSIRFAINRLTRESRERGKQASVRDWHALRTTFVTLALSAGVPMELVRRITGHATVQVVLDNYFRPDGEQFKAALTKALPRVLTGHKPEELEPAAEITALGEKLAAGNATPEDRNRLRLLVAKV